ncbi:MAG TPA: ArsA-related P-loop ATPase [Candidatus Binataceae bacterium]|nr:ArsA-related P-loop ATPase [Candidatus Binataceae bacterium]
MKKLFKPGSIVVVVGAGGVGKTTIAAALGLGAARAGFSTGVLTVDPARRLRDALGIARLEVRPRPLDARRLRAAGLSGRLVLAASSMDVKATWDGMIERLVKAPTARRQILENKFYQNLTQRFAGAEAYAALEQLLAMHESGKFGVEVVDTPPTQQAFDFIEAPAHLARLLDSRSARWLLEWTARAGRERPPVTSRIASLIVAQIEKFAGALPLFAIAQFFGAAAEATDALRARMVEGDSLLRSSSVNFVLVTTAEENRLNEACAIIRRIENEGLRLAAVVINRVADEKTFTALAGAPGRVPPHLREAAELQALASTDQRLAAIAQFLADYAAEQAAAISRAAKFAREIRARVSLIAIPELQRDASELRWLTKVADALEVEGAGGRFLEQAARAFATHERKANARPYPAQ